MNRFALSIAAATIVVLFLTGCPAPDPYLFSPLVSRVMEDNTGQKYLISRGNAFDRSKPRFLKLYTWDSISMKWVKKTEVPDPMEGNLGGSYFLDKTNTPAQSFVVYNSPLKEFFKISLSPLQVSQSLIADNHSVISADELVVYEGSLVKIKQLSTNVTSNLHTLPSLTAISNGLGLNIDVTQFQLVCTPEYSYPQWDFVTHFCIMANAVGYPNNPPSQASVNNNYFYEMNIVVHADGSYTYKLIYQGVQDAHSHGPLVINERDYMPNSERLKKATIYSSVIGSGAPTERADDFTVDNQGNLHLFYVLKDSAPVYYEFYDKNNPTVPLYKQALP